MSLPDPQKPFPKGRLTDWPLPEYASDKAELYSYSLSVQVLASKLRNLSSWETLGNSLQLKASASNPRN